MNSKINVGPAVIELTGSRRDKEVIDFSDLDYIVAEQYPFQESNSVDGPYFTITFKVIQ